ncbi:hypothetical protein SEA_ESTES_51 [Mycobacterium phage Estes]|uniref:Uncharacterized protein n=2 Tax=Reyvirus TaxID=1623301 RepID=A0A7G9A2C1_9CAUD|nr:hypothetical protein J4U03_gp051 [Mycobacterium phage Estes]YP_010013957.1 hypothetical protein J4U04_gp051 [Mycobacterium phage MrMagoo]APQ42155.1 hypothetical protein PBI_MRMAGOO_51 [Mycobacterium phage MrMagoo]ARM70231.1 hypothetical protein SEA_GARDENSALSA_51 [Mycobacterium phage GardenSalsa]QNL30760.1 hypothetical protein SEA_ESTES_51 [Mycobacterium phage Estes]
MSVNIKHEISLSDPMTLEDMEQFVLKAKQIGVNPKAQLSVKVTKGYSDFRESWPDSVTITARPR